MGAPGRSNADRLPERRREVIDGDAFGLARHSHRELEADVKRTLWVPLLVVVGLIVTACQPASTPGGGAQKPAKLTIAAVQGNEDAALKAVAPLYEQKKIGR